MEKFALSGAAQVLYCPAHHEGRSCGPFCSGHLVQTNRVLVRVGGRYYLGERVEIVEGALPSWAEARARAREEGRVLDRLT